MAAVTAIRSRAVRRHLRRAIRHESSPKIKIMSVEHPLVNC
jgi:hypothetical protein